MRSTARIQEVSEDCSPATNTLEALISTVDDVTALCQGKADRILSALVPCDTDNGSIKEPKGIIERMAAHIISLEELAFTLGRIESLITDPAERATR